MARAVVPRVLPVEAGASHEGQDGRCLVVALGRRTEKVASHEKKPSQTKPHQHSTPGPLASQHLPWDQCPSSGTPSPLLFVMWSEVRSVEWRVPGGVESSLLSNPTPLLKQQWPPPAPLGARLSRLT